LQCCSVAVGKRLEAEGKNIKYQSSKHGHGKGREVMKIGIYHGIHGSFLCNNILN
jgi:hypothetical protein